MKKYLINMLSGRPLFLSGERRLARFFCTLRRVFKRAVSTYPVCTKVMLVFMFITLLSMGVTYFIFTKSYVEAETKKNLNSLEILATSVGYASISSLIFDNKGEFSQNLARLSLPDYVLKICVYDEYGFYFGRLDRAGECPSSFGDLDSQTAPLSVIKPIYHKVKEPIAFVYVEGDRSLVVGALQEYAVSAAFIFLTMLALSGLLARALFGQLLVKPLRSLLDTAKSIIESSDYSMKCKYYFNDEIGELTKKFNQMITKIKGRDDELKELNAVLSERAQQLDEQNSQLKEQKVRAERSDAVKTEFIRNMSHEFRTPLHAIESFAHYIIEECDSGNSEKVRKYASSILKSSRERMYPLICNIMDMARAENQGEIYHIQRFYLYDIVLGELKAMEGLIMDKGLKISFTQPEFNTELNFDSKRIAQVIRNLLANAIKFSPKAGQITIIISEAILKGGEALSVSVRDQGVGIPADELDLVFGKFQQSSRTKTGAGGTGLGLSISKAIIKAHNGEIFATNASGSKNAVFTFIIPKGLEICKKIVKSPVDEVA